MKIGAQLYTLRDYCKTLDDFDETLKKLRDIGYTSVQVSGVCPYTPEWLSETLAKYSMTCDITHTPFERMYTQTEQVVNEHLKFGCHYIGLGSYNSLKTPEDLDFVVEKAKQMAPVMRKNGCLFMYHNHFAEMNQNEKGVTRLMELAERTDADEVGFTLDTYWLQYGGADISDYVKALKGRIPCVHFKDMKVVGTEIRMAAIGDGTINFEKIVPMLEDSGTKYVFFEQDNTYGEDPFECMSRSYKYMKSIGLE